jgi:hypothetical protein
LPLGLPGAIDAPAGVGAHASLWAGSLHALWRSGHFDVELTRGDVPGLGADVAVALDPRLPPTISLVGDRIDVALGSVTGRLTAPELFSWPIQFDAFVRISARIVLDGEAIAFTDHRADEVRIVSEVSLTEDVRTTVENWVRSALHHFVERSLAGAIPTRLSPVLGEDSSDGRWTFAPISLSTDEQRVVVGSALTR